MYCNRNNNESSWSLFGLTILIIAIIFIEMLLTAHSNDVWNGGHCGCGGAWEFTSSRSPSVYSTYYYYKCPNCGAVIETNHLM